MEKLNVEWVEMVSLKATNPCSDTFPSFTVGLSTASIMFLAVWTLMALLQSSTDTETDGQEFIE